MAILDISEDHARSVSDGVAHSYKKMQSGFLTFDRFQNNMIDTVSNPDNFKSDHAKVVPVKFLHPKTEQDKIVIKAPDLTLMVDLILETKPEYDRISQSLPESVRNEFRVKFYRELFAKHTTTIVYDKPPTIMCSDGKERPIWFNKSKRGVNIRPGFLDGDATKPTPFTFDDSMVHAIGGGITGSGKSVLINSLLVSLMLEYPPHELRLWLCDFKKVELTKYATPIKAPHAFVVAATESPDYIITLFQHLAEECRKTQVVLENLGLDNIKDVEDVYGFIIPRNFLLVDEFVQLFENIKEDPDAKTKVIESISYIARIGRNAGYHMFLTSQSMGGVLPESVAKQFKGGIALKSDKSTSKEIIGNEAAIKIEGKGFAYATTDKSNEANNRYYSVPYISAELDEEEAKANAEIVDMILEDFSRANELAKGVNNSFLTNLLVQLREKADQYGDYYDLDFFNQDAQQEWTYLDERKEEIKEKLKPIYEFDEYLEQKLVLGDISMYRNGIQLETADIMPESNNNILVVGDSTDTMYYGLKLMNFNMHELSPVKTESILITADTVLASRQIKQKNFKFDKVMSQFNIPVYQQQVTARTNVLKTYTEIMESGEPFSIATVSKYGKKHLGKIAYNDKAHTKLMEFVEEACTVKVKEAVGDIRDYIKVGATTIQVKGMVKKLKPKPEPEEEVVDETTEPLTANEVVEPLTATEPLTANEETTEPLTVEPQEDEYEEVEELVKKTISYVDRYEMFTEEEQTIISTIVFFTNNLVKISGLRDKIVPRDFSRKVYYIYGLDKVEDIAGVNVDTQLLKTLFKDGTQVGIYVIFFTTNKSGLSRISPSIGYVLERTSNIDLLSPIDLKRHKYYGDHFIRLVYTRDKAKQTYVFKRYRLDMIKETGFDPRLAPKLIL